MPLWSTYYEIPVPGDVGYASNYWAYYLSMYHFGTGVKVTDYEEYSINVYPDGYNHTGTWEGYYTDGIWPITSIVINQDPFRFHELDRLPFAASEIGSAKAMVQFSTIEKITVTYTWDGTTDIPNSRGEVIDTSFSGTIGLVAILMESGNLTPRVIATEGTAATITSGGAAVMDATNLVKAYLNWRGKAAFFEIIFIVGGGYSLPPADEGTEAALNALRAATYSESVTPGPNITGTATFTDLRWYAPTVSNFAIKLGTGAALNTNSRVVYAIPPRQV